MRPRTILISDDEPRTVTSLARQANRLGLTVIPDSESEAFELAKQHRPDLVLLDVNQRVDGVELLQRIKHDDETRGLTVVMFSSSAEASLRATCLNLGAAAYFQKPCDETFVSRLAAMATDANDRAPRAADVTVSPAKQRVLVVDAVLASLARITALLSAQFEVVSTLSAADALAQLEKSRFHVLCVDDQLPLRAAPRLLTRVKELHTFVSCMLIATTTQGTHPPSSDVNDALAVLAKPYDPKRLVRLVEQLARLTEVSRALHRA